MPTPLNISGDITILLSRSDQMSDHGIKELSTTLRLDLFNFHILHRKHNMWDLMRVEKLKIKTRYGEHKIKTTKLQRSLLLQPAKKSAHGTCNKQCYVLAPDLYEGKSVLVHGITCVLTPPGFPYGPFCPE